MAASLASAFTKIANAIRGKNKSQSTYTPAEMVTAIDNLNVSDIVLDSVEINTNGTRTPPTGHAYNSVTVNVDGGSVDPEQGIVTVPLNATKNGVYTAIEGMAFSAVTVLVTEDEILKYLDYTITDNYLHLYGVITENVVADDVHELIIPAVIGGKTVIIH